MKLVLKGTNLDITPSLQVYIDGKMSKIGRVVSSFDKNGAVECRLEVGRTSRRHHKGSVFRAEGNLALPGRILRAVEKSTDVRKAISGMREKLEREVRKYKTQILERRRK